MRNRFLVIAGSIVLVALARMERPALQNSSVAQFAMHEVAFEAKARYANPYVEVTADASLTGPDGRRRPLPLYWDGASSWKFRFAADQPGEWRWSVTSGDPGLNGRSGRFTVHAGGRKGSIRPMRGHPAHFERQDGARFWFLGDTAWALFTDSAEERHDRAAAFRYVDARAAQGFNVMHSMVLSEAGWGNRGGPPFRDIATERLNSHSSARSI